MNAPELFNKFFDAENLETANKLTLEIKTFLRLELSAVNGFSPITLHKELSDVVDLHHAFSILTPRQENLTYTLHFTLYHVPDMKYVLSISLWCCQPFYNSKLSRKELNKTELARIETDLISNFQTNFDYLNIELSEIRKKINLNLCEHVASVIQKLAP